MRYSIAKSLILVSLVMASSLGTVFAENPVAAEKTKHNVTIVNALKEGTALHVLVANNATTEMNLTNWRVVTDNNNATFTFPIFMLEQGKIVTIHTHKNNNTAEDLFGSNFMWNGTNEIKLLDDHGSLVSDYHIGVSPMKH